MTTFTKLLGLLLFAGLFNFAAHAEQTYRPMGDGMPLPWPFPWAKDCPVNWDSMQGRYLLTPSAAKEQVDLEIRVVTSMNVKLVHVSRYGSDGVLIADGYIWIPAKQKSVRLWLFPLRAGDPPTWAVLKMYHRNTMSDCNQEGLIPILTLEQVDNSIRTQSQYRLVRVRI